MTEPSDEYKVEFYAQETDNVFIVLLTFSSTELAEDIRIASDTYELLPTANVLGVVSGGLEYLYAPFDIRLPKDDQTGAITAKITIDNIDQSIIGLLRSIQKPVSLDIQVVLSRDPNTVEWSYTGYSLNNIEYDAFTISGNLNMDYWDLEPFPSGRFNPSGFPGLF